ncbi:unnamed protein product [Trichobilharzia regenti]|nr:unnamed protein product [Trichobilharzia regenti]
MQKVLASISNQLKLWSASSKTIDNNHNNKLNKPNLSSSGGGGMPANNNKAAATASAQSTIDCCTSSTMPNLFTICLRLLSVIYERDSRHPFTPDDFWLISLPAMQNQQLSNSQIKKFNKLLEEKSSSQNDEVNNPKLTAIDKTKWCVSLSTHIY